MNGPLPLIGWTSIPLFLLDRLASMLISVKKDKIPPFCEVNIIPAKNWLDNQPRKRIVHLT